jgi:hypothetical protein
MLKFVTEMASSQKEDAKVQESTSTSTSTSTSDNEQEQEDHVIIVC